MDSKEAMKLACRKAGVKIVAEALGVSPTAIYNQINDSSKGDILRKFVDFTAACEDDTPIRWACEELNGVFIKNPELIVEPEKAARDYVSDALKEFSDVIREIGISMADNRITAEEAQRIRKEWEELKALLEAFVLSAEFGYINKAET